MPIGIPATGCSQAIDRKFDSFDEMAACLATGEIEILRSAGGAFDGSVALLEMQSASICWVTYFAPVIVRAKVDLEGRLFMLRLDSRPGRIVVNGHVLDDDRLVVYPPRATQHAWAKPVQGGIDLLVIIARSADLERVSRSITGAKFFSGPGLCTLLRPSTSAMDAARAFGDRSTVLGNGSETLSTEARAAIGEKILVALVTAVTSDAQRGEGHEWSGDFSARLVGRAEDFVRGHASERIRLRQLCTAADATERQLERAFRAVYGVTPTRYLKLHRLHLARGALRKRTTVNASVANVATRFGFQDLGRFATAYRALFGESPSTTLGRPREA